MYLEKISHDNNLITGQNPWSVWILAESMIRQLGYMPKPRTITAEENSVKVLYSYETNGNENSRVLLKQIIEENKQSISRTLLIDHSAISILQGDIRKFYDLLRLAAYAKDIESNK